jgi:type I restriction enzyme S subunit
MQNQVKTIADICTNLDGRRIPLNENQRRLKQKAKLYPYVGANGILDFIDEYIFDEEILCVAEDGGSWGANNKCSLILKQKCWINNHAHVLRVKEGTDIRYLNYFLNYSDLNKYITGTTRGKLTKSALNRIEVPLPPLETQKKIAAILDKANELRQNDKKILERYDRLAQSVFLEMFGDPIANPNRWAVDKLMNRVSMKGGGTPSKRIPEYYTGTISWVSPKDMKSDYIIESIDKITEEALQNSSASLVEPYSVLLVVRSGILKNYLPVAINLVSVAINQDMKALKCKSGLNPYYLMYNIRCQSDSILQNVRGTTADNISSDVIKKISLTLPPMELQNYFAKVVVSIKAQRQLSEQSLQKSEELFQSLLQRAFRGELC